MHFRDRFGIPLSDEEVGSAPLYKPDDDSAEARYLQQRRRALGGYLPLRRTISCAGIAPDESVYDEFYAGSDGREVSTTLAFVRLLGRLLRDEIIGDHVVPIVPDEARTFGMETLFRQAGIYSHVGQLYEPVDADSLIYYKETTDGRSSRRGSPRRGSLASFIAARHGPGGARRVHAAVLHLLLDVRLPARRRPGVGRRGLAHARLPRRRDGGPHDAAGRGAPAPGRAQPRARLGGAEPRQLRPGVCLRGLADRARGHPPHARAAGSGLLLLHRHQRGLPAAADARGRRERRDPRHLPASAHRTSRALVCSSSAAARSSTRSSPRRSSSRSATASPPTCGRSRATASCGATRRTPTVGTCSTPASRRDAPTSARSPRTPKARSSPRPTT